MGAVVDLHCCSIFYIVKAVFIFVCILDMFYLLCFFLGFNFVFFHLVRSATITSKYCPFYCPPLLLPIFLQRRKGSMLKKSL